METSRYYNLEKRITELSERFFVKPEDDGSITSEQEDKIRAYILLCHAEIENYIEDLATNLLDSGVKQWETRKTANYNIASLFLNAEKIEKKNSMQTKSEMIFSKYREVIKHNNGIKGKDISSLFYCLGYEDSDFDSLFLGELDALGSARGETAHTSANNKIKTGLNFNDKKLQMEHILSGLKHFEEALKTKV